MTISVVADWATVIAVVGAPIFGGVWWWWTRRRQNKRVNKATKIFQDLLESKLSSMNRRFDVMKDDQSSEAQKVIAHLNEMTLSLYTISVVLALDFEYTHGRPSELPDLLSKLRLQWPIANWDEPP